MDVYDVADPANPKKLSHFDTSGPHSRGVHYLWYAEGPTLICRPARKISPAQSIGRPVPDDRRPDRPGHPKETGRWWMPGTRVGDKEPLPPRVQPFNSGIRMHTPTIAAGRRQSRLCRLDRWRMVHSGHHRQGASENDRAPVMAVAGCRFRAYRAGNSVASSRDPDRGGHRREMQGLAEARLGLGHFEREGADRAVGSAAAGGLRRVMQSRRSFRRAQHSSEPAGCHGGAI